MRDAVRTAIDGIYDTAIDPTQWQRVAVACAEVTGASTFFLQTLNTATGEVSVLSGHGLESLGIASYEAHYHKIDIWRQGLLASPVDRVQLYHQMIDQKTFEESEVFNDWVKPGVGYDVFWGLGSKVGLWDRRSIAFAASHRSRSQGEMTERDRAAFRQLMPHLQRVLHLQSILKAHEARGLTLEAACDTAADGLFIVDAGGHVLYANRAALRLLAHGASLHLSREGRLQAGQPAEDAAMRRQIAAACSSEAPGERAAYLKFTGRNGLPLVATVSPVRAEQAGQRVRCCILAVQDIWKARSIDPVKIELALGLTKAEARLVGKLAEGMSMRDAAAGLGITYNTARTQLSSALQKTGLRRQNELMLAVSGLRHG